MRKLRVGTLFSGIGAPEWALKRMGIPFETLFACDNGDINIKYDIKEKFAEMLEFAKDKDDPVLAKKQFVDDLYASKKKKNFVKISYLANHDIDENRFYQDVCLLDGTDFRGEIDLLVGGSPCQAFSMAGYRRGFDDHRGQLFFEFCRIVDEVQPKVFLWENVKGVLSHDKGKTWEVIQQSFKDLGYKIFWKVLNAKDYGIPQSRNRLFVLGFLDQSIEYEFPSPVPLTTVMKDYLDGFANSRFNLDNLENTHEVVEVDDKYFLSDKAKDSVLSVGTNYFGKPEIDVEIANTLTSTMHKMHRSWIDNYVTDLKPVYEKYFLSEKMEDYVMNNPCAGFNKKPELDREIAHVVTSTVHKMKNATVDNYVVDLRPIDDKYFLSEKMEKYILQDHDWNKNAQTDRDVANTIVSSYYKMHKAGLDNYVTDLKPIETKEEDSNE